jgi:hypothetical protein
MLSQVNSLYYTANRRIFKKVFVYQLVAENYITDEYRNKDGAKKRRDPGNGIKPVADWPTNHINYTKLTF